MKKLFAILAIVGLCAVGCAGTGNKPAAVDPSTVQNTAQVAGSLAAIAMPFVAPGVGGEISAAIGVLCGAQKPTDLAGLEAEVGALWTKFNSANSAEINAVLVAINTAYSLVSTAVAGTGKDVNTALGYVNAFETGICLGFNGPAAVPAPAPAPAQGPAK